MLLTLCFAMAYARWYRRVPSTKTWTNALVTENVAYYALAYVMLTDVRHWAAVVAFIGCLVFALIGLVILQLFTDFAYEPQDSCTAQCAQYCSACPCAGEMVSDEYGDDAQAAKGTGPQHWRNALRDELDRAHVTPCCGGAPRCCWPWSRDTAPMPAGITEVDAQSLALLFGRKLWPWFVDIRVTFVWALLVFVVCAMLGVTGWRLAVVYVVTALPLLLVLYALHLVRESLLCWFCSTTITVLAERPGLNGEQNSKIDPQTGERGGGDGDDVHAAITQHDKDVEWTAAAVEDKVNGVVRDAAAAAAADAIASILSGGGGGGGKPAP